MRSVISALFLFAVAACAPRAEPDLNPIAESYVHAVLELGAHEEGYIDAYYGPAEWRTQAEASPRSVAELKTAFDELAAQLADAQGSARDPIVQRRARTLAANVASARFRLDMIEGARAPFEEEAERLFAVRPTIQPLEHYDAILARIEQIAPGAGDLGARVQAVRARYVVPRERMQAVMDAAIAECRRRTAEHLTLPEGESFTLEFVSDKSWSAYNYYQGGNRSLIQVNTDQPLQIDRAIGLGCHEGYPGHHVQAIYAERMYRERGWVEFSVAPLYMPAGPLMEGGGNFGVDLAFPGAEKLAFERETLYPLAGLDPATAETLDALNRATAELGGARLTIAQMYLDGQIDRARAVELSQRYRLQSRAAAEQGLDFVDQYRSYSINYVTGEEIVRAYVERAGADPAAGWAAYESIFNQPTLAADLQ